MNGYWLVEHQTRGSPATFLINASGQHHGGEFGRGKKRMGFGRLTSHGIHRSALWDVVVEALLNAPAIRKAERVYLMITKSAGFNQQVGFEPTEVQQLLVRQK